MDETGGTSHASVLADFGEFSLRAGDLGDVLHEACRLVGRGLGTDLAKVMEMRPDGSLLVRAGVGWSAGVVGHTVVPNLPGSSEHEALRTNRPFVIDDVAAETRLTVPDFIRAHGVSSLVNVPIPGAGTAAPFGLLQVDSRAARKFGPADTDFLRAYANLLASAVERLLLLPALRDALEGRDRLLRELQHRVKNNLQVITSLVQVQAAQAGTAETRRELEVVGQRVEAMRLLHARLYVGGSVDALDLAPYLRDVAQGLVGLRSDGAAAVRLEADLEDMRAAVDVAVPLGLVVNEFVTNSLKHAFGGGPGTLGLMLRALPGGLARIVLWDDGKGLPPGPSATGTGLQIIEGLARQVGATHRWVTGGGARLELEFTPSAG
ncbi:GAF domain-containing protein [Aerophototrophica crusticola]|uniref:histidine kinase n=1 Tax=Aerophototrophica crusticola TaxID=1709002 RepID=A0A858R3N3_9PROT|nr:GAF domain-containing protein [Rhodospirillaceae bacterium B3]